MKQHKLHIEVGDKIVSAITGILYIVKSIGFVDCEVFNTEENHRDWLYTHMITENNFYKWED